MTACKDFKKEIRLQMKQTRKGLSQNDVEVFSKEIARQVTRLEAFQMMDQIYSYLPIMNEVDTTEIMGMCYCMNKKVAVPKVEGDDMNFYNLTKHTRFEESSFHVLEPVDGELLEEKRGLMLVPGLAFDKNGYRIGYGKGFYDKYLADKPYIYTVGLAYDFQVQEALERDELDVPLHMIVTEKQTYYCGR